MRKLMLFLVCTFAIPQAAVANSEFETREGCMSRLSQEISVADAVSNMDNFWQEKLAPSPERGRDHADRIVEIKAEIASLQSELTAEMLALCSDYE